MARGSNTGNRALVPQAQQGLEQYKYEVASELGLNVRQGDYWGNLSSRDCGSVGGHMVRRMIQMAEQQLAGQR